jgi:hypothetical protein
MFRHWRAILRELKKKGIEVQHTKLGFASIEGSAMDLHSFVWDVFLKMSLLC